MSASEKEIYTAFLSADSRLPVSFKNATVQLKKFCVLHGAEIIDNSVPGEPVLLMDTKTAGALAESDFIEQLPVPGNHPAVIRGRVEEAEDSMPGIEITI